MQRSASSAPGLAYELSRELPSHFPFSSAYDRSSYGSTHSAFENAVRRGHLPLARAWAAQMRRNPQASRYAALGGRYDSPTVHLMRLACEGSASDGRIWRSRHWLRHAAQGRAPEGGADHAAREAIAAFCAGRPRLGLWLARELLSAPPEKLARATDSAMEWPLSVGPELWEEKKRSAGDFKRALEGLFSGSRDSGAHPKKCGLLAHLAYWAKAVEGSDPGLSQELAKLNQELWERGAFDTPIQHAERFAKAPYGPADPRAAFCVQGSGRTAGEHRSHGSDQDRPDAALFAALLARCAQRPDAKGRDGAVWDAFVAAHAGAPQANPNPFAAWGAGSAALISLCSDARLIELGLDRGFSPEGSQWLLVKPGAMITAFRQQKLPSPKAHQNLVNRARMLGPEGFGVKERKAPGPKSKKAGKALKNGDPATGLPKAEWHEDKKESAESWTFQSLPSVALMCGHAGLARRLVKAGCPEASFAQALSETAGTDRHTMEALSARFESESLFEATGGSEANHPSVKKVLRA